MSYNSVVLPADVVSDANVRLGRIEAQDRVTVILAVESGSRAWGFPSPDSDNDVRFLYVRPISHYVGLDAPRDVIERPIDGLWDIGGWDIGKAIRLLVKGNATVAEWLSSPLIYREHGPMPFRLRSLIKNHASPEASARHYWGLTNTCYMREIGCRPTAEEIVEATRSGEIIKGLTEVSLKKYFYAVRGALALSWIKKFDEIPPMTLPALMAQDIMSWDVRSLIQNLQHRKATTNELGTGSRIKVMDDFIEEKLAWAKSRGFDKTPTNLKLVEDANALLLEALGL